MSHTNGQVYQVLPPSELEQKLQRLPDTEVESSPPPQRGLNLRPYLRIAQRKVLLIAGITAMTTVAAAFASLSSPTTYQGSFQLLVEPVTSEGRFAEPSRLARESINERISENFFELDYSTILTILNGSKMRTAIVEEVKENYPNISSVKLGDALVVERLLKEENREDSKTSIIQVSYNSLDPELTEAVLETTAKLYLKYSLEERKSRIGQGVEFIEEQLPELQQRVNVFSNQIQAMQEQYNLINPQIAGEELFDKLRQITDEKIEVNSQLSELKILSESLQQQLQLNPNEAIDASALSEDPSYQDLLAELKEIESQIAIESARFTSEAPQMQALQEKRQNLQNLIDREVQRILGKNAASAASNSQILAFQNSTRQELIQELVDTTNQIQVLETRNQTLTQTQQDFERQAQQFPAIASQYNTTQQQLELTNETLKQLLGQRETLRVEAAQDTVPWELISPPEIPRDADGNPIPQSSVSYKKLVMGVAAGLLLGFGVALLYEKFRDIFYTVEEIEEVTQLPVLGKIPRTQNLQSLMNITPGAFGGTAVHNANTDFFLDAVDSLYTNIRFCFATRPIRSLAVCSATPGDGKSTIALHLAQTAAAMGQKVLLVDANLRSPKLHRWLNLPNGKGLSDLLENKLTPNEAIQKLPLTDNLFVLTSGQPLPNSPKQLASAQMEYIKEKFKTRFDLVIYDTPNLLSNTDASFIGANTDGILMVVRVRETKQSLVKQAIDRLKTFGLPTLGVVANRVKRSSFITSPEEPEVFDLSVSMKETI